MASFDCLSVRVIDSPDAQLVRAGEGARLLQVDPVLAQQARLWQLQRTLLQRGWLARLGVYQLVVEFDPLTMPAAQLEAALWQAWEDSAHAGLESGQLHRLPVCYGGDAGPDLPELACALGLSVAQLIELHCAPEYQVLCLGFLPGFAYLGGLDARLHAPRRASPRAQVAAGSVGIGGAQTGIYPQAAPGGWQLIGHCASLLFDPRLDPPCLLQPGDRVRFVPERT